MLTPQRAVVTGGAGFIGSHMVDLLLNEGFRVTVIDDLSSGRLANLKHHQGNAALDFEERDLRSISPDDRLFAGADYVFHFAGRGDIVPSIEQPQDYLSVNVMATVHALEAARHARVKKFVYAASSSCYGLADVPTREDAPIRPQYPYALSKRLGEEAVLHWAQVYHLPVVSMRIFNAFGPRARTSGAYGAVFGVFLAQKLAGKPFTVVGDGKQTRDFVYVTDVARAFLAAAWSDKSGEIYNVGTGCPHSVNAIVDLIGGPIVHVPRRPGEPECTLADITKIGTELGWEPVVPFAEGVKQLMRHIHDWQTAPVWDSQSIEVATKTWFSMLAS
jgi:UDP-glucose 4-epimerase